MEWTRGPAIGRGSTATVSLATATTSTSTSTSGELFAVKSTDLSHSSFLQKEQRFLCQLSSPHIVKYMGFDITTENNKLTYNLFMEYVPGDTLSGAIQTHGGSLDECMIRSYTHQILQGLEYLHWQGLVHCDIKGQNVLIGKDGAKIADLGCARLVEGVSGDGGAASSAFSGTPVFMAPEVARGEEQGFPADVWALGCTVIEMATGCNPWPEVDDPVSALYQIGFSGDVPECPRWLSEEAKDFLSKCLMRDPRERWTVEQLLRHPFLDEFDTCSSRPQKEFITNSPISVLDQGLWDLLEVSEIPRNLTHTGSSSTNSPAERIRLLIGGTSSPVSNMPNWTSDEDWVMVRSNDIEEGANTVRSNDIEVGAKFLDHPSDKHSIDTKSLMASIIHKEALESSTINEHLLLEYSVDNVSDISSFSIRRGLVMACDSVNDVFVLRNLNSERDNENFLFFNISCLQKLNLYLLCLISIVLTVFRRSNSGRRSETG